MSININEVRKRAVSADEYINGLEEPFRERFLARKRTYMLRCDTTEELHPFVGKYLIVAFSASWCKDCAQYIPVLALLEENPGLEAKVFGGLKKDPLSHACKWRIPPSPREVVTFKVDKIPLIIILDSHGKEVGRVIESPKRKPTLEQEICEIIKST